MIFRGKISVIWGFLKGTIHGNLIFKEKHCIT